MKSEIYILPADDSSQFGDGSLTNPVRSTRNNLDYIFQQIDADARIKKVILGAGIHYTRGPWLHPKQCQFSRSIELTGQGKAILALDDENVAWDDRGTIRKDTAVLIMGPHENNGARIVSNLTIEPNADLLPVGKYVTAGIWVFGNFSIIENNTILPLRGSLKDNHETFAILTNNRPNGVWRGDEEFPNGRVTIQGNTIYNRAMTDDDYDSAIHLGHLQAGGTVHLQSYILNNKVFGIGLLPCRVNIAGGSRAYVAHNYAKNVRYAIYNDTGHWEDFLVDNLIVDDLAYVALAVHRINDGYPCYKRNIIVDRSRFNYKPQSPRFEYGAMTLWNKSLNIDDDEFTGIKMQRCFFSAPPIPRQPFFVMSISAKNVLDCGVMPDCVYPTDAAVHIATGSPRLQITRNGHILPDYKPRIISSPI